MTTQPESKLSRDIMAALRARGVFCYKVHGGPMTMAGLPDIIACVPMGDHGYMDELTGFEPVTVGIFVGFETKTPAGGDPSPVQKHVHNKIRTACGQVFVPRSVEDAIAALVSVGWVTPPPTAPNVSTAI